VPLDAVAFSFRYASLFDETIPQTSLRSRAWSLIVAQAYQPLWSVICGTGSSEPSMEDANVQVRIRAAKCKPSPQSAPCLAPRKGPVA
jgi:hypothetical protein